MEAFKPAGNGATPDTAEGFTELREYTMTTAALRGNHMTPGSLIALKVGAHLHAAVVNVVNARQRLMIIRPDAL